MIIVGRTLREGEDTDMGTQSVFLYIAHEVLSLIDHGQSDSMDAVKSKMDNGSLIEYLEIDYDKLSGKKYKGIDLTLLSKEDRKAVNQAFSYMLVGYGGKERGKWGIEHNGLCLVVAWAISLSQVALHE